MIEDYGVQQKLMQHLLEIIGKRYRTDGDSHSAGLQRRLVSRVSMYLGILEIEICSVHVNYDTSSSVPRTISRKETTKEKYPLIDYS